MKTPGLAILLLVLTIGISLGGCSSIRTMIIDQKSAALMHEFNALDDCDRVSMVQGYLQKGQHRIEWLDAYLPTNGTMLDMVGDICEKTGICRDVMISCWSGSFGNGSSWPANNEMWLSLVEPWRASLGCDGGTHDNSDILRMCDPELASVLGAVERTVMGVDSTSAHPRIHVEAFNDWSWGSFVDEVESHMQDAGVVRPENDWRSAPGDLKVTCDGVLPQDADPEVYIYFGKIGRSRFITKVMTRSDAEEGLLRVELGDLPQFKLPGLITVWDMGDDGPRAIFSMEQGGEGRGEQD